MDARVAIDALNEDFDGVATDIFAFNSDSNTRVMTLVSGSSDAVFMGGIVPYSTSPDVQDIGSSSMKWGRVYATNVRTGMLELNDHRCMQVADYLGNGTLALQITAPASNADPFLRVDVGEQDVRFLGHVWPENLNSAVEQDLGSSSKPWRNIYVEKILAGDSSEPLDVVGDVSVSPGDNSDYSIVELLNDNKDRGFYVKGYHNASNSPRVIFEDLDSGNVDEVLEIVGYKIEAHKRIECHDRVAPDVDNAADLGTSSVRWDDVYCYNLDALSDQRHKHDIQDIDPYQCEQFVDNLRPRHYKFNNGRSQRTHTGLISQEVHEAMLNCGMSPSNMALWTKRLQDEDGNVVENGIESLRYIELIPYLVSYCQELQRRLTALEEYVGYSKRQRVE